MFKLKIDKMHCMSCFRNIDDAIKEIDGDAKLAAKIEERILEVDSSKLSLEQVMSAIEEAGYPTESL